MKLWNFFIFCVVCVPALAACGTKEREFPGHTRDQVWKAMVQAAEDPRYADWIVVDNEVWRDDTASRIEIRRDVRRDVMVSGSPPRREEFEWRFSALVTDATPPAVEFSTSTIVVPAHFWLQARHYLDEVERRLNGLPLENKATIAKYSTANSSKLPDRPAQFPVVAVSQIDANTPPEIASPEPTQAATVKTPVAMEDLQTAVISAPPEDLQTAIIPVAQPVADPEIEPVAEPVVEPAPIPVAEPIAEPVVEAAPIPVAEPVAEPVVEPAPIPVVEPVVEAAPIPVAQPVSEPLAEPSPFEPPPMINTVSSPIPASTPALQPIPEPDPVEPPPFEPPPDP